MKKKIKDLEKAARQLRVKKGRENFKHALIQRLQDALAFYDEIKR